MQCKIIILFSIISILRFVKSVPRIGNNAKNAKTTGIKRSSGGCLPGINPGKYFELLQKLEDENDKERMQFNEALKRKGISDITLNILVQSRGAADREIHNAATAQNFAGKPVIPAGINLGGGGALDLKNNITLFFHRVKLRNNTNFRVDRLQINGYEMVLYTDLTLNDLYFKGEYDSVKNINNTILFRPTLGEVQLVLGHVRYNIQGRLRLMQNKLQVEHIDSRMTIDDAFVSYMDNENADKSYEKLRLLQINDFEQRVQADLDFWLKDYFNDYFLHFELEDAIASQNLHSYENQKQLILNDFMDQVVEGLQSKLGPKQIAAANPIPDYNLVSINGQNVKLHNGVLRGLDSLHRQSVATTEIRNGTRIIDAVIGFSKLRMEYHYEANTTRGPLLEGVMVLPAEEYIAQLQVRANKNAITSVGVSFLRQMRFHAIVIEGPLNKEIRNFRHLLEHEIYILLNKMILEYVDNIDHLSNCKSMEQAAITIGQCASCNFNLTIHN